LAIGRRKRCTSRSGRFNRGSCGSRIRHEGCGGRAGKAELLTGIDGVSSWPVRRIVLRD
jgi:hypothetical protein